MTGKFFSRYFPQENDELMRMKRIKAKERKESYLYSTRYEVTGAIKIILKTSQLTSRLRKETLKALEIMLRSSILK